MDVEGGAGEQTEESGSKSDSSSECDSEDDIVLAQYRIYILDSHTDLAPFS